MLKYELNSIEKGVFIFDIVKTLDLTEIEPQVRLEFKLFVLFLFATVCVNTGDNGLMDELMR